MEKQKAAIKFRAAARCARITHDLTDTVKFTNSGLKNDNNHNEDDEIIEN